MARKGTICEEGLMQIGGLEDEHETGRGWTELSPRYRSLILLTEGQEKHTLLSPTAISDTV